MSNIADVLQVSLQDKNGETKGPLDGVEVLALYFSAHWCPPCRGFTPTLADCYKKVNESKKRFEIVFVSLDRTDKDFNGYYAEMPWLAVPFSDDGRDTLSTKYHVSGIPALIFINMKDGSVINPNGRGLVDGDKNGEKFPWV